MSAFTADTARALPGPASVRARREAAAERFAALPWPNTDEEVWRYSRIADLDLDAYALAGEVPEVVPPEAQAMLDLAPDRAAAVVSVDGHIVHADVDPRWASKGLRVGLADHVDDEGDPAVDTDVFAVMNEAFASDPVVVRIPAGLDVDGPILVVSISSGAGVASFPRLIVDAGADSGARVVDVHRSAATGGAALVVPVTAVAAGRAARLGLVTVQDLALATWYVGNQVSTVGAEATFISATAGLGGDYARQRTDCRLAGQGATGNLLAVYFGEADQTLDFRTFQDHAAPDTTSSLLFKGAVGGASRSVYTGLIRVRKNARGTNAFQTNRNIKLSDRAWAESVPNLEIENNDVRCSHASAVGPIDEEQRFYLESRGVPPTQAERLVVSGFFDEVLEQFPEPTAIVPLRSAIAGKLDRRDVDVDQ